MTDDDLDELLTLGAAGALTENEQRHLDEVVAGDPALAARYAELQTAAATLAVAAGETPPEHLRESVLRAAAAAPSGLAAPASASRTRVHHLRWMVPSTVAAAVVALVVVGLVVDRSADAPTDDRVAAALADPQGVTVELRGSIGELELVQSPGTDTTLLIGHGINAPDTETTFQLWAIHDGAMDDMGTFVPTATGDVMLVMDGVSPPDTEYAVTVEPMDGSEQPTGDHVADT